MHRDNRFFPVSRPHLAGRELDYVVDAVKSGWISSLGGYVTRFEKEFADFCGTAHAVSVCNGTAALHLVLHALDVGPGDEVIVPDLSFIATANAVRMTGAAPVFCDIDAETLCLDPERIEAAITPRTRAIMPVHLYGHPADMHAIDALARRHGLWVVEDAAEAHGAAIGNRRVGGFGHCAAFSFYANKNMTTGEGGMITTDDGMLAGRLRHLRDHAMSPADRYRHSEMGFNYRMTNLQAAIGCAQLEQLAGFLERRRTLFEGYRARLADLAGLRLNREAPGMRNSYWMVCAEIEGAGVRERDTICHALRVRGVDTRPYFRPMSAMPYLPDADTPVARQMAARGFNLPTYIDLGERDLDVICGIVRAVLAERDCTGTARAG